VLIRKHWGEHLWWIVGLVAGTALTILLYKGALSETGWERRPTGSTGWLFWFGVLGGSICLFEFLLWPRKHFRVWRVGAVKAWMKAHIWLGLLAVPLLLFHSGFYFRNTEATILFALFVIVILSGLWGLVLQQYLPEKLLKEVPVETIFSQIGHISNLLVIDAEKVVVGTCGVPESEKEEPAVYIQARAEEKDLARAAIGDQFTVGKVREFGTSHGELKQSRTVIEPVPNSEPIRHFYNTILAPYLRQGKQSNSELASGERSKVLFEELRLKLDARAHFAVDELEKLADERRLLDHQAHLHFWLHNWLWVHLPLSVALIVLMFVHIFKTLQYLWPGPV
jgi:hypothetical protein